MITHPKISVLGAYDFEKLPKTGLRNVAEVYLEFCKNQTKGERDLKYGLKNFLDCPLTDFIGLHANPFQNFGQGLF